MIEGVLRGVSGSEMGEMEIGFGEAVQEWFGVRSEGDVEGNVEGDVEGEMDRNRNVNLNVDVDGNLVSGDRSLESDRNLEENRNLESVGDRSLESNGDKYRNLESDRNSDRVVLQTGNDSDKGILLREIGEFISGKARILLISSEEFDWLDSRGMVENIICDGNMGMLVIDGGEEYSLARLHGYRCMMAGNDGKLKRDWNGNGKLMNKDVMGEEIKNGIKNENNRINKEIKNEKNNEIKNEKNGSNLERTGTNLENKIEEKIEIRNFYNRESDLIEEKCINDLDKASKEKRNMIFDIILNDNEKDLEFFENVMNGFVISDYDFMYKGNEEFDWVRRGAGGMFICNVKKDFNMMERVKDDVDKYFELFLDNSTWSEKVLRG